jgi:hypothetical protein
MCFIVFVILCVECCVFFCVMCVNLCVVLNAMCYFVQCVLICVYCVIVVPLPPGTIQFVVNNKS